MDEPGPSHGRRIRLTDPDYENKLRAMLLSENEELYLSDNDTQDSSIDDSEDDPDFVLQDIEESSDENLNSDNELLELDDDHQTNIGTEVMETETNVLQTYIGKSGFKWESTEPPRNTKTRKHNIIRGLPGLTRVSRNLGNKPTKSDIWNSLIDDEMLNEIVLRTNYKIFSMREKLSESTNASNYRSTDIVELKALIGLFMLSSIIKSSHEDMLSLFSKDTLGRPIFRMTMSSKRFEILLSCLRFDNHLDREERKKSDKTAAISAIFNKFVSNSQKLFTLGDCVTVDEMLLPFRGHCGFRIYMPNKPAKYGIKVMCMTDARSSYFYNGYIYAGKDSDGIGLTEEEKKLSKPSQSVIRLCKPIEGSNRNVTADNYFSSIELTNELKKRSLTYVGTLKKNKREVPPEFLADRNRRIGTTLYGFSEDRTLISYVPKKNKAVLLISSMHHTKDNEPGKPEIIKYYNHTKSGVDVLDMKCANYSANRRTRRWPLAVFYTVVNISTVNSFNLYLCFCEEELISRFKFVKELAYELLEPHLRQRMTTNIPREIKTSIENYFEKDTTIQAKNEADGIPHDKLPRRKLCSICPSSKMRKTNYGCVHCSKPICLECSRKICVTCIRNSK